MIRGAAKLPVFVHRKEKVMKTWVCTAAGVVGSGIAALFGGWDASLITLLIFMAIDYGSGLICAAVFKASPKSETGALESYACWKGLCRKCMILLFVLIGARLDLVMGISYIRDAVCIAFIASELISITENAGLMGIPLPAVINSAVDILTIKAKQAAEKDQGDKDS